MIDQRPWYSTRKINDQTIYHLPQQVAYSRRGQPCLPVERKIKLLYTEMGRTDLVGAYGARLECVYYAALITTPQWTFQWYMQSDPTAKPVVVGQLVGAVATEAITCLLYRFARSYDCVCMYVCGALNLSYSALFCARSVFYKSTKLEHVQLPSTGPIFCSHRYTMSTATNYSHVNGNFSRVEGTLYTYRKISSTDRLLYTW